MRMTKEELEELRLADEEIDREIAEAPENSDLPQRNRRCTLNGPMSASLKYYYSHREYYRQRYYDHRAENQARARAYSARYYVEHAEQEREKAKEYYLAHRDEAREWHEHYRAEHRDELNRKRREFYAAHRDEVLQKQRERRAAMKEAKAS